jgi:hypothetical protein
MIVRLLILLILRSFTNTFDYGQITDSIKINCPFTILKVDHYDHQDIATGDYIIKTYLELVDYWESAFGPFSLSPLPNVYFSSKMVIVLNGDFGGQDGGSKINSIYETKDKMIIDLKIITPKGYIKPVVEWICTIIETKRTDKIIGIIRTKI